MYQEPESDSSTCSISRVQRDISNRPQHTPASKCRKTGDRFLDPVTSDSSPGVLKAGKTHNVPAVDNSDSPECSDFPYRHQRPRANIGHGNGHVRASDCDGEPVPRARRAQTKIKHPDKGVSKAQDLPASATSPPSQLNDLVTDVRVLEKNDQTQDMTLSELRANLMQLQRDVEQLEVENRYCLRLIRLQRDFRAAAGTK
ncbi:uncharacterized protein BDV14DRAFT_163366 [Aspergillus stella-maris]|uniref:uncharacterized protein n=1 Tax=Aspergillus stella-maris TaxID=1810926 RepID=UPI003CCDC41F